VPAGAAVVPNGPTVAPLMRANSPDVVVHKSPLPGTVGATPCGRLNPAVSVVDAAVFNLPVVLIVED
jgi:hypothetical protein